MSEVYTVDVSDRFGDYGTVGVLILEQRQDELFVDTLLLSCRVLGRGVEHRIAAFLGETAIRRGLSRVTLPYERTAKNSPAREFLENIEFGQREKGESGFVLRVCPAKLAQLQWRAPQREAPRLESRPVQNAARRAVDYACIANELASVGAILHAIRSEHGHAGSSEATETEGELARIWAELLERPSVSPHDNFFDLGGHSLLAVLLLLRIRETFGVELSIDDVYSGTLTLADLAARIETAQLGGIDPKEYAALVAEIEGLSDEEARQLLETEDPTNA